MHKIKTKFDNQLGCYHSYYDKVKDVTGLRKAYLSKLMAHEELVLVIETNLGSVHNPDAKAYIRDAEAYCQKRGFPSFIRFQEAQRKTGLAAIFSLGRQDPDKYRLVCHIPAGSYDESLFEALLDEYDLQLGYKLKMDGSKIMEEMDKGFCKSVKDKDYFESFIYDSRLFMKLLTTEPVLPEEF